MKTVDECHHGECLQGICRRDFLKQTVAAGTGFLAAGCGGGRERAAPSTINAAQEPPVPAATSSEDYSSMAYCGIRCRTACPEKEYPHRCGGCKSAGGTLGEFCSVCAIRKCAGEKQVLTCAHCDKYASCEADTWTRFPILREKIDRIRRDLQIAS